MAQSVFIVLSLCSAVCRFLPALAAYVVQSFHSPFCCPPLRKRQFLRTTETIRRLPDDKVPLLG